MPAIQPHDVTPEMVAASAPQRRESRDVVFSFFRVDWRRARRRELTFAQDRLFERLTVEPSVRRLVVASHQRSVLSAARARLRHDDPVPPPRARIVEPMRLRRRDPTTVPALERTYRRYDRALARASRRHGLEHPVVITPNPLFAAFAQLAWAGAVVYYATDDWTAHQGHAPWSEAYASAQDRLAASDRRICAVSEHLIDKLSGPGPRLVLPNGIAAEEWLRPDPAPAWFAGLPGPRLLYAGTLDARLDADLLHAVADAHPDGSLVLLGPSGTGVEALADLPDRANVVVHDAVGRRELAAVVAAADVCLLPHVKNQLTLSMSPLKVYEYLAAGRPIAAVDLPPVRGIDPGVVLAAGADDYLQAVAAALTRGPAREAERLAFIERNSWASRHEQLLDFAFA